jgi:2-polyprenyl-3-methyl-5-hydroxy-6-metoxy-1,4-benzoquinol methylase
MVHPHSHDDQWHDAQHDEKGWWDTCANTYWEETKQIVYARHMGIVFSEDERGPYCIDLGTKDVLDIGGGPVSLLLKATKMSRRTVADPCDYPEWVGARYMAQGIDYQKVMGEQVDTITIDTKYDEVWLYNCLQHVDDPQKIITNAVNALKPGGVFRIFEWINMPTNTAHPHTLTKEQLDGWIGQSGKTTHLSESGCYGEAYFGAFTIVKA